MEKNVGKTCKTCGQVFDPSIAFCPTDGTKLSTELVVATSHELIQVTSKHAAVGQSNNSRVITSKFLEEGNDDDGDERRTTSSGMGDPYPHLVPTLLGQTLDNQYEVQTVIGKGGMSFVYRANHLLLRKTVAIKTLLPHLTLQATSLQRFQQEAQAASNLKHPNIIAVHTFGTTPDGEPYLVMDYVEGSSIAEELEKYGFVQVDRAVDIFIQVADALAHAHQRGIIHRDLKPSNILLLEKQGQRDFVNIVDFGIAKMLPQNGQEGVNLTQTGEVFGSPLYMSPEQCRGDKLDARADIYSMGCLMYETLTGRAAIAGDNTMEVLYNHLHEIPKPMKAPLIHVPAELERIVFKTLAKDPAQRYQSMDALRDDLVAFREKQRNNIFSQIRSAWALFWLRRKPRTKRDKIIVAIACSGILLAGFFAFQLLSLYWSAADSPASKIPLVWEEDRAAQQPVTLSVEDTKGHFDVMFHRRVAEGMEAKGEPSADIINYLAAPAEFLAKRHLWKAAIDEFELAFQYSVKVNDYLSLRSMHLRSNVAECYLQNHEYEKAAGIFRELLDHLTGDAGRDFVDRSVISYKLGSTYYLEGKYQEALERFNYTYGVWTKPPERRLAVTFYSLPSNLESNYDYSMLVSRIATSYQRLYEQSVADGKPEEQNLKSALPFFRKAELQWSHSTGEHEGSLNGVIAKANYLYLYHLQHKEENLDADYKDLAVAA
ncbi:MAG TPA: serine/threonine-protein kinase [Drouetiella sp.]